MLFHPFTTCAIEKQLHQLLNTDNIVFNKINSGMTNEVYQVTCNSAQCYILKIFNPQLAYIIDRPHEIHITTLLAKQHITSECIFANQNYMLLKYIDGKIINFDHYTKLELDNLCNTLCILHSIHAPAKYMDITQSIQEFYQYHLQSIELLTAHHQQKLRFLHQKFLNNHQNFNQHIVLCHNDLNANNCIINLKHEISLIDFEYTGYNDIYFDIAYLAKNMSASQFKKLLNSYYKLEMQTKSQSHLFPLNQGKLDYFIQLLDYIAIIWYLTLFNYTNKLHYYQDALTTLNQIIND